MTEDQKRWFVYGYLACLVVDTLLIVLAKGWAWLGESEAVVYTIPPKSSNNGTGTTPAWEVVRESVEGIAHT